MKSNSFAHDKLNKAQRKFFHGKLTDHSVSEIGGDQDRMTLQGVYDRDQLWFSFMSGALFLTEKKTEQYQFTHPEVYRYHRYMYRYSIKKGLAEPVKVEKGCRKLVNYDIPDQFTLPFHESRRLTATEFKALATCNYPGFERDEKGRIFKFKVKMAGWKLRGERKDARDWCEEMCNGRFYITTQYAYFALAHDALLAKLAFG